MTDLEAVFQQIDTYVAQMMQAGQAPGLALALTDRNGLLRVASYGYADSAVRTPVTPETLFEIGSIGKSFTSIVLLQEHAAGRIDLHAPVTTYLPWFQVQSEYAPITLHHLMTHTAGIILGSDFAPSSRYEVWALRDTVTASPPGTFFHYSNVGYKVLGLVLEEVIGQPYSEIIQTRILDPLGMTSSAPTITNALRSRLAVGYTSFYDDRPLPPGSAPVPATWLEYTMGDGSIVATAADLATYLRMLLNRGQGPNSTLLSPQSFELLTQRATTAGEDWLFYGYGIVSSELDGAFTIGHDGGMIGYVSTMMGDMDNGLGVVVLMNGFGYTFPLVRFALQALRAVHHGQELPALPARKDPRKIANAADYAGTYTSATRSIELIADGESLTLCYGGHQVVLEQRGPDTFVVNHPDFALFPLRFQREQNQVVEACHGADWYTNDAYSGPVTFDYPLEWIAYPGHYRSYNPWFSNFRVVLRKGALLLLWPTGGEETLVSLGHHHFRVGADARLPEQIHFDTIVAGQSLRATLSGCEFYRVATP